MRRRITYANVAATLALVFSMSGGALAASHYLVNSTKQISPKVLRKLRGSTGKTGAAGKEGAPGKEGPAGKEGATGKEGSAGQSALSPLPAGDSESGEFGLRSDNSRTHGYITDAVNFAIPLPAPIQEEHVIHAEVGSPVAHCSGPGHADPGYLCLYEAFSAGVGAPEVFNTSEGAPAPGTGRYGFQIEWIISEEDGYEEGTYTVTAG
jgi:hypothetical protein